ncbi:hypothetical protein BN1058_02741 [Paraliobacillus sp. PM-2]|nr:YfhD family protein [Paraliobacillus sp. PM-2]CQR48373.1 hypothetical protein BN1058_02741 [Paraliobacillus sp. PM-2]
MTNKDNDKIEKAEDVSFSQSVADIEDKEALERMKQADERVARRHKK